MKPTGRHPRRGAGLRCAEAITPDLDAVPMERDEQRDIGQRGQPSDGFGSHHCRLEQALIELIDRSYDRPAVNIRVPSIEELQELLVNMP